MPNFPYDTVLFDLDGTLTRSEEGILKSAQYALEKMGRPAPDMQVLRAFIGPPLYASFRELCGMTSEEAHQAVIYYRERYTTVGLYENAVYPGIRMLLRQLRANGAYLAVATGKPQKPTEAILDHFGLAHFFHAVAGTDEKDQDTSKKRLIKRVMPDTCHRAVMVGDRHFDVEGAKDAGIDSIGVAFGYGSRDELQNAGATHIANTVGELTELLCPGAKPLRGVFLSVEGLDGSGKTTQVDYLEKYLLDWGYEVLRTREPGGCLISEKIRNVVLDTANVGMSAACEALLYAASRAQHVHQVIRPAVSRGLVVLCDRFVDSSIAYQGGGRELGIQVVAQINEPAVDGLMPDCTVYLDIDHQTALNRRKSASALDRIEIEESSFHGRVEEAYKKLIASDPERFVKVDASLPPEEIGRLAFEKVFRRLSAGEE